MMSLRVAVSVILVLLLVAVPQARGSIPCMSFESSAPSDSQAHYPPIPSNGCSSSDHAAPSFATSCCGMALLPDGFFLLAEKSLGHWGSIASLAPFSPVPTHWRPPA